MRPQPEEIDMKRDMKLSEHFALDEFCKSKWMSTEHVRSYVTQERLGRLERLAHTLEIVRAVIGGPIVITSGFRTPALNAMVGGAQKSDHMTAWACDFQRPGLDANAVYDAVLKMRESGLIAFDQLIRYPKHTHISVNPRLRGQHF